MDFGQSRLNGLGLGVSRNYPEESEYQPSVGLNLQVLTETSLIVRQYDRLSQQQLIFLLDKELILYTLRCFKSVQDKIWQNCSSIRID